jgi:hypothetical protein
MVTTCDVPQDVSKSGIYSKSGCRETVVTAGAAGMSVQAKNTPKGRRN